MGARNQPEQQQIVNELVKEFSAHETPRSVREQLGGYDELLLQEAAKITRQTEDINQPIVYLLGVAESLREHEKATEQRVIHDPGYEPMDFAMSQDEYAAFRREHQARIEELEGTQTEREDFE
jgi:hypothetical protein